MIKRLSFIFTAEVMFAGFLFSSVFKGFFDSFPIDITALFMIITIFIALKRLMQNPTLNKKSITPITIYALMGALVLASMLYTSSTSYGSVKVMHFLTVTAWSFLGVFLLIKNQNSLNRFLKGLLFYGSLTTLFIVYSYYTNNIGYSAGGRVGIGDDGGNVLGLGRMVAVASIIIAVFYFYEKRSFTVRLLALIMFCLSVFVLLLTGSRMPFISFIISLGLLIPISINFRGLRITKKIFSFVLLSFFALIALIPLYLNGVVGAMFNRLLRLFETGNEGRSDRFEVAIDMWRDNPVFGQGIGSFSIKYSGMDIRSYAHNIFLEVMSELGMVGLILLTTLLIISLVNILKIKNENINIYQISVIIVFFYALLNANTTGDINDNRWLFSFIALACMLPSYGKTNKSKSGNIVA